MAPPHFQVSNPADLADYGVTRHQHGLETVNLGLRLPVGAHHLKGGSLRARCVASSPWPSSPTDLGRAAPLTDNREALLLGKHPDRIDQPNNPIPKQRPDTKLNPLTQIAHLYISYTSSPSILSISIWLFVCVLFCSQWKAVVLVDASTIYFYDKY